MLEIQELYIGTTREAVGNAILQYFNENGETTDYSNTSATIIIEKDNKQYKLYTAAAGSGNGYTTQYTYYESKVIEAVTEEIVTQSTAKKLQSTVSKWYSVLRDIAVVASLSILVYIGIRIMLSSTSKDKAKYKQLLMDWVVAFCLLFMMHYIMSLSNYIVEKVIALVDSITITDDNTIEKDGVQLFTIDQEDHVDKAYEVLVTEAAKDKRSRRK